MQLFPSMPVQLKPLLRHNCLTTSMFSLSLKREMTKRSSHLVICEGKTWQDENLENLKESFQETQPVPWNMLVDKLNEGNTRHIETDGSTAPPTAKHTNIQKTYKKFQYALPAMSSIIRMSPTARNTFDKQLHGMKAKKRKIRNDKYWNRKWHKKYHGHYVTFWLAGDILEFYRMGHSWIEIEILHSKPNARLYAEVMMLKLWASYLKCLSVLRKCSRRCIEE